MALLTSIISWKRFKTEEEFFLKFTPVKQIIKGKKFTNL